MDEDFQRFFEALMRAASQMCDAHYFQLPVAGSDTPEYRERVYCYELYHQLRNALGDDFPYKLCGEVDKSAHPIIQHAILRDRKPDFIVHEPGKEPMSNLVVVEVKPRNARLHDVQRDIAKLEAFITHAQYYRSIMLMYGEGRGGRVPHIVKAAKSLIGDDRVLLLWHSGPGREAQIVKGAGPGHS
jgi:hypothetical protein